MKWKKKKKKKNQFVSVLSLLTSAIAAITAESIGTLAPPLASWLVPWNPNFDSFFSWDLRDVAVKPLSYKYVFLFFKKKKKKL